MKAVVFTLGCKVNECESDSLIAGLTERGYEVSDKLVPADIYIVNTCAVTAEAEKKSRQTAARCSSGSSTSSNAKGNSFWLLSCSCNVSSGTSEVSCFASSVTDSCLFSSGL